MKTCNIRRALVSSTLFLTPAVVAAGASAPNADRPTPDQAWNLLREGNARFVSGNRQNPNQDAARRAEVASGQNPFAIILSCADSRVAVEHAFDRGIGDLFVIRVAGNVSDTDEIGTIEYGAGHLHSPLLVVMGHSACGAVSAVVNGAEVHGSIPGLVDNIIPAVEWVKSNRPELKGADLVNAAIEANVWQSIDDLFSESQEVRTLVEGGSLKVVGAVYDLASGRVRWMGEHPYQDRLLHRATDEPRAMNVPEPADRTAEAPANSQSEHESSPMGGHSTTAPRSKQAQRSAPSHSTGGHDSSKPTHKTADAPTNGKHDHR